MLYSCSDCNFPIANSGIKSQLQKRIPGARILGYREEVVTVEDWRRARKPQTCQEHNIGALTA